MKEKRTPWYPARIKPARVGQYETRVRYQSRYTVLRLWWDGEDWRVLNRKGQKIWLFSDECWRGLAAPAKDAA